jgi:hypothetical protein
MAHQVTVYAIFECHTQVTCLVVYYCMQNQVTWCITHELDVVLEEVGRVVLGREGVVSLGAQLARLVRPRQRQELALHDPVQVAVLNLPVMGRESVLIQGSKRGRDDVGPRRC